MLIRAVLEGVDINSSNDKEVPVLSDRYGEYSNKVASFLTLIARLADIDRKEFVRFKKDALKFCVY